MNQFRQLWTFIKDNRSRFMWEVFSVLLSMGLGYVASYLVSSGSVSDLQAERAALLKQKANYQALLDSLKWSSRLIKQNKTIDSLQHENRKLRERNALDSAARLSPLESMDAINKRYKAEP